MANRKLICRCFILALLTLATGSCFLLDLECEGDEFGDDLEIIVELKTYPDQDTFHLGDTLYLEIESPKFSKVAGTENRIQLDSFNFHGKFAISEISGTEDVFGLIDDVFAQTGHTDSLKFSDGVIFYPFHCQETATHYILKVSIELNETGLFYFGSSTNLSVLEKYDHPAMYKCDNEKRRYVSIQYSNSSTSEDRYENLFLRTEVDYLQESMDFERYTRLGAHTFVVVE